MKPKTPFWEESYGRPGKIDTFGEGRPSKALGEMASRLTPGSRVLDVGCGEGRNALHLASLGFKVTAFDISVAGIGKLLVMAKERRLSVDAFVADMREYDFAQPFDLILCMGCLQMIKREEWREVLRRIQAAAVPGGLNIVGVLTDALPEPPDLKGFFLGIFKEGELFEYYRDWEIVNKESSVFTDKHPTGFSHQHACNNIVARKPR
jgi:tellurite methyltransferase